MTIRSFNPHTRTLMGPGPSDVSPRVLQAMGRPTIGHLDPEFIQMHVLPSQFHQLVVDVDCGEPARGEEMAEDPQGGSPGQPEQQQRLR